MKTVPIPEHRGKPIISHDYQPAFRIDPQEILFSIKQQFPCKEFALRELGQNSVDADATRISSVYAYEGKQMIIDWFDDGCGMTKEIICQHYLVLFDSPKETILKMVGYYSLGKISALCYEPIAIEVFSLSTGHPGYRLAIDQDLSGRLYEIEPAEMAAFLGSPHGTLVRLRVAVCDQEKFIAEVNKANECIIRELSWVKPEVKITTVELSENGQMLFGSKIINREMEIPGQFSKNNYTIKLSSGLGEVQIRLGLKSPSNTLQPITLCKGRIPVERPANGLSWTGGEDFFLRGINIVFDSFSFQTNIGRNVVYKDTAFINEFLPKFFSEVLMDRFVKPLAELYAQPRFLAGEYENALKEMFADVCVKAAEHSYSIPEELLNTPFIPSFINPSPCSLVQLDNTVGTIYFTYERPSLFDLRTKRSAPADIQCLCLADLPWEFKGFLEVRYGRRFVQKEDSIFVRSWESDENMELSRRLNQALKYSGIWDDAPFNRIDEQSLQPLYQDFKVGEFHRFDGSKELTTASLCLKNTGEIFLNSHHSFVSNLMDLLFEERAVYSDFAAHLLMREIIFCSNLELNSHQRENMLTRDLSCRFGLKSERQGLVEDGETDLSSESVLRLMQRLVASETLEL